tara:strand:+ start:152 stop:466 length:315 start_codon:yes stop_codon:yes gene_type:complete
MTKFVDTRLKAALLKDKHFFLNQHLLECYQKICESFQKSNTYAYYDISLMIKHHKALISRLQLNYKNKPKSLDILLNFSNSNDKLSAFNVLTNTLNNKNLLSQI